MKNRPQPCLFRAFPDLAGKLPWVSLGTFPTPVEPMAKLGECIGASRLFVKRDDRSGEVYGGNKVRKLEFALADALERGRAPVITLGAVGSNHVLATTIYAAKLGLSTIGVFIPQPVQENLRTNILCNCFLGCRIEYAGNAPAAGLRIARVYLGEWLKNRRRPYFLPPGGSSAPGTIGYLECALELAEQIKEGLLPEPAFIFAPVGSGGTLAGLVLGVKLAGLKSRPIGVGVYDRRFVNEKSVARQANRGLKLLRGFSSSVPALSVAPGEVHILHDYYGPGYAHYTRKGVSAIRQCLELTGMKLEGTYTGKCMAGLMDFMREPEHRDRPALFINTYNSVPLEPLLSGCPGPELLPAPVRKFFAGEVAPVAD